MYENYLPFFVVKINDHDYAFCTTASEALEEVRQHMESYEEDSYCIEQIQSIWELVQRYGAMEQYSNAWMEDVLETIVDMIREAKKKEARP